MSAIKFRKCFRFRIFRSTSRLRTLASKCPHGMNLQYITVVELCFKEGREHTVSTRALCARNCHFHIMKATFWLRLDISFHLKALATFSYFLSIKGFIKSKDNTNLMSNIMYYSILNVLKRTGCHPLESKRAGCVFHFQNVRVLPPSLTPL